MNICDILVEQVKLRPNSPAVYSSSGNFTYAELGGAGCYTFRRSR